MERLSYSNAYFVNENEWIKTKPCSGWFCPPGGDVYYSWEPELVKNNFGGHITEWRPQVLFIVGDVEVLVWDKSFIFYFSYPLPQRLNKTFKQKHAMVNHKWQMTKKVKIDRFIKKWTSRNVDFFFLRPNLFIYFCHNYDLFITQFWLFS